MSDQRQRPQPNLYLIGFMGVGKSLIGRQLSRVLRMGFVDSDQAIEQRAGRSIAQIFATDGEAAFRALERDFIESGHPSVGMVVSCGGGLPVQPGMADLLREKGVVVCLFASPETVLERTLGNPKRPLLNVENPAERIRQLMAEREPIYKICGIGISTEGRPVGEIVSNVVRIYRREARSR
ncbi:MAG: hypothetical protein RL648_119 [Verrucomicrobiota bacterium]|jgi:shikimate kinase